MVAACGLQGGKNLVLRQSGEVDSGAQAHIYAAGVQQPVSLQFFPDGYEWPQAEPVALWHGTSSDQVGCQWACMHLSCLAWPCRHAGQPPCNCRDIAQYDLGGRAHYCKHSACVSE